jgi:cyanate permease
MKLAMGNQQLGCLQHCATFFTAEIVTHRSVCILVVLLQFKVLPKRLFTGVLAANMRLLSVGSSSMIPLHMILELTGQEEAQQAARLRALKGKYACVVILMDAQAP